MNENKQNSAVEGRDALENVVVSERSNPQTTETNKFPDTYGDIPYSLLVKCMEEELGGKPAQGSLTHFIFSMSCYLRYVCNDDPEWIAQVLPTYGVGHDKWKYTINSACQRSQVEDVPGIVQRSIKRATDEMLRLKSLSAPDLPPAMPKKLPPVIAHLVKNVPEVCRPAVANGVFPALAAHLEGVTFPLIDGTEKEATFMCVNLAKQSSGKSAINMPVKYIVADLVERDKLSRQREQEWKAAMNSRGANKDKPERPDDLCVQVLVSDMTNAAFVQRMEDAGGRYLYTNLEELGLLKQLQTNGTKDVSKIICLCFDNGVYGQERVGTSSVTARVQLRWNWNASSTISKGIHFFNEHLDDGTLSRINFCTIIPDKSKPFVYGRYDEAYAETLKPYITNLNLAHGEVVCKPALALARRLQDECDDEAALCDDEMMEALSYRAVTIAYQKAIVLYIANGMKWSKDIAEFAEWSLKYDLWCKFHFFSDAIENANKAEVVRKRVPGRKNLLDELPVTFTLDELNVLRRKHGMEGDANGMLRAWVHRGHIVRVESECFYMKTPEYLDARAI